MELTVHMDVAGKIIHQLDIPTKLQKKGVTMNTEKVGNQQISRHSNLLGDAIRNFLRYVCDPQDYQHGHTKRNQALADLERQTHWFHEHNISIHIDYSSGFLSVRDS